MGEGVGGWRKEWVSGWESGEVGVRASCVLRDAHKELAVYDFLLLVFKEIADITDSERLAVIHELCGCVCVCAGGRNVSGWGSETWVGWRVKEWGRERMDGRRSGQESMGEKASKWGRGRGWVGEGVGGRMNGRAGKSLCVRGFCAWECS